MNSLEKESFWNSIKYRWKLFCQIILEPWFVFVAIISIVTILFSYNTTDKSLSLYLNIIACFLMSIAGAICYDRYMQISGNTILVKKGKGAVRNLFLLMDRIRNISSRSKENAANEEIRNLLGFIEKDVYNSIQEWTDVIPVIAEVEEYTNIMNEKETEVNKIKECLSQLESDNEQLSKQVSEANDLKSEKETLQKEKENLLKLLEASESELDKVKQARKKAITASSTLASSTTIASMLGPQGPTGVSSVFVDRSKVGLANFEGLGRDERTGQFIRRSPGSVDNLIFKPSPVSDAILKDVKICSQCGKPFTPDSLMATDKCDICRFSCQVLK